MFQQLAFVKKPTGKGAFSSANAFATGTTMALLVPTTTHSKGKYYDFVNKLVLYELILILV